MFSYFRRFQLRFIRLLMTMGTIRNFRRLFFQRPKQRTRDTRRLYFPLDQTHHAQGPPLVRINVDGLPPLQLYENGTDFFTRDIPRHLRGRNVIRTLSPRGPLFTKLDLPLFLTISNQGMNLRRILLPRRVHSMNTSTRTHHIKIHRRSGTIFINRLFRRLLALLVLVSTRTIHRRSRNINRVERANHVMFTLRSRRAINIRRFRFLTRLLPPTVTEQRDTISDEIYTLAN